MSDHTSQQEEPAALTEGDLQELRIPILYGGILFNHFGHFMLESLGRLWAYDQVRHLDPYLAFHPAFGSLDYLNKHGFAYQTLTGFRIPVSRILLLDRPLRLKQVLVPEMLYGYDQCRAPTETIQDFMRSFEFHRSTPEGFGAAAGLYVSRSELPASAGRPMAEKLFEKFLQRQGYTVLFPERHSLHEQLTLYSNAERIIFCDGAALHSCILLPDLRARVAVVSRRRDPRWDCSGIADQFRGYGQQVTWIDAVCFQYQFGLESWDARTYVDWYEVSCALKDQDFTAETFDDFRGLDSTKLVTTEIEEFVSAISNDPRFTRYLARLQE